jgi:ribonuclease HII
VVIDRLGGRSDYRPLLRDAFPDRHLHEVGVSEGRSCYRLASARNDLVVEFLVDADARHLPVALASMLSKYVREALMWRFNEYWRRRVPHVKATAGYYADAQRFLAEIRPSAKDAGIPLEQFVRAR